MYAAREATVLAPVGDTMPIYKLKRAWLDVLEQVKKAGKPLLMTKRRKSVSQVVTPPVPPATKNAFGCMAGTAEILGDIVEPLGDDEWEGLGQ